MLFVCGGNVISVETAMHKRFVTIDNISKVEVVVRAITLTDVGIRLPLPISLKVVLNSSASEPWTQCSDVLQNLFFKTTSLVIKSLLNHLRIILTSTNLPPSPH